MLIPDRCAVRAARKLSESDNSSVCATAHNQGLLAYYCARVTLSPGHRDNNNEKALVSTTCGSRDSSIDCDECFGLNTTNTTYQLCFRTRVQRICSNGRPSA